jgi:hypothetical protein
VTRPTVEGLGHATDCLEQLAWRTTAQRATGYPQAADLLDLLVFLDAELQHHRDSSSYGPGTDAHTIGRHGLNRPTEGRLDWGTENGKGQRGGVGQPPVEPNDQTYRDLRKLQRDMIQDLVSKLAQYQHRANEIAGWPHRSEAV